MSNEQGKHGVMLKCEECKCLKEDVCTLYNGSQIFKNQWGGCWFGTPKERGVNNG